MAGSLPNFQKIDSRSACIQGVLKVKVKVKGHVVRALSWVFGMSYSFIDGLVSDCLQTPLSAVFFLHHKNFNQNSIFPESVAMQ